MILGVKLLKSGNHKDNTVTGMMVEALNGACEDANIQLDEIEGLFTNAAISAPNGFQALVLAETIGLLPSKPGKKMLCKTMCTGGSSGIQGVIELLEPIRRGEIDVAAVVTADQSVSMDVLEMLEAMHRNIADPRETDKMKPIIPLAYNKWSEWHMHKFGTTREQLAMVSAVMAKQAHHHPLAMGYEKGISLEKIIKSPHVGSVMSLYECSRRADGAAAVIIVSERYAQKLVQQNKLKANKGIKIIGYGEASGSLWAPEEDKMSDDILPLKRAAQLAYQRANKTVKDIDFFALYDCFPVTLLTAVEHVGLAPQGGGGKFWEERYNEYNKIKDEKELEKKPLNINTHGGLMHFGAPGSAAALFNVVEAVHQIRGEALGLKIPNVKTAFCYGNGGILSHSAVVILNACNISPPSKL